MSSIIKKAANLAHRAADSIYAFRFIRFLVQPWDKTEAFALGLIDENGRVLKKARTPEEKAAYSYFVRLVFNVKRALEYMPFGKTRLSSYISALFLLRESFNLNSEQLNEVVSELSEYVSYRENMNSIEEFFIDEKPNERLTEGQERHPICTGKIYYTNKPLIYFEQTSEYFDEVTCPERSKVIIDSVKSYDFLGHIIYECTDIKNNFKLFVSESDLLLFV